MKISINLTKGTVDNTDRRPVVVGIDLGTTNSLIAYMLDEKPVAIKEHEGSSTLVPSVVYLNEQQQAVVGDRAKDFLVTHPERTIFSVKRLMGKSYNDLRDYEGFFSYKVMDDGLDESLVKIRIGDTFYTPIELSAKILRELKYRAEKALGQPIEKAVITVPAYFNDTQRQATRDAGKLAGLEVLRIVNEPTAASLAYGIGVDPDQAKTIAVYDLGGGTFDISILRIENGIFEVLATNGDTFLGGDDFDRAIVRHWLQNQATIEDRALLQQLRLAAERAKKQLCSGQTDVFRAEFPFGGVELDLPTFNQLIQPLVQRSLDCCQQALSDAKLTPAQLDEVVLVGGSTRVPLVKQALRDLFQRPLNDQLNPDEVVALGAAVQADILAGNRNDMLLLDVTPLSLGIETMGGLMDVILPRNSKVPISVARQYTTSVDGQVNLKVAVYQGERDLVKDNRLLGEFVLRGIPPMPAHLPKIEIAFLLNADGILKVRAKELRSGVEQTVEVRSPYSVSTEDMARMLKESVQFAQNDMQLRSLIEARTEAQAVLLATDKFLEQNADWMSESDAQTIQQLAQSLEQATTGEDKDLIQKQMDELNSFTMPLAHVAMDHAIAHALQGKKI